MTTIALSLLALALSFGTLFAPVPQGLKVGDKAPDFKLKNIDDKEVSLYTDYAQSKGVVLVFSCNHCPYVVKYEDRIQALHKKFEGQGYPVLAINSNDPATYPEDSFDNMKKRAKDKGFTFRYLFDETQATAKAYGAEKTPHVYLLSNNSGNWVVEYIGAIDDNPGDASKVKTKYVEDAIEALQKGKKPAVTETKAIGCGIKWKQS